MVKHIRTPPAGLPRIALCLVAFASVGFGEPWRAATLQGSDLEAQTGWPDKHFTVDAAGNISPQQDYLHSGQRAVWTFATASPANALVRQTDHPNDVAAPYDPTYVNELMTPLPKGMSGIFVISENQEGFIEQTTPCVAPYEVKATRTVDATLWYLCGTTDADPTSPNYQKTMDATWANPAITGVFIRLKWSDIQTGPTTYSETAIARLLGEVDKAVANGKVYSIAIKSGAENDATPAWLFDPPAGGCRPDTSDSRLERRLRILQRHSARLW